MYSYILLLFILIIIICFILFSNKIGSNEIGGKGGNENKIKTGGNGMKSIRDEFYKYYDRHGYKEVGEVDVEKEINSMVFASLGVKKELLGYKYKKYKFMDVSVITNKPEVVPVVYALAKSLRIDPDINYYLLLSGQKKIISNREINSAEYHPNTKSVFVFREEEWVKTLIHEMMHSRFGKKYKDMGCPDEAIVETMAQYINCAIADGDWNREIEFGLGQSAKVIELFGKDSPAYEYHYISTLFKLHITDFLHAIKTDNFSFFKNYNQLSQPKLPLPNHSQTLRMSITEFNF